MYCTSHNDGEKHLTWRKTSCLIWFQSQRWALLKMLKMYWCEFKLCESNCIKDTNTERTTMFWCIFLVCDLSGQWMCLMLLTTEPLVTRKTKLRANRCCNLFFNWNNFPYTGCYTLTGCFYALGRIVPPGACRDQAACELLPLSIMKDWLWSLSRSCADCCVRSRWEERLVWLYFRSRAWFPLAGIHRCILFIPCWIKWGEINMGIKCMASGRANTSRMRHSVLADMWHAPQSGLTCGVVTCLHLTQSFIQCDLQCMQSIHFSFSTVTVLKDAVFCLNGTDCICHTYSICEERSVNFMLALMWKMIYLSFLY